MNNESIIEIDGSYLEGGGQALRNAVSLSAILKRPVRVVKIRTNRLQPGLIYQHLHGVNLLRDITSAKVTGNKLYSTELEFVPSTITGGFYEVHPGTAASITLICQMVLPTLLYADKPSHIQLTGGTNVVSAPQIEYMQQVLLSNLKRFGINLGILLLSHGFYPRGGGLCELHVKPLHCQTAADFVNFGQLKKFEGVAYYSGWLPKSLGQDMQHSAKREIHRLWSNNACDISVVKHETANKSDVSVGINLTAHTSSGCVLGAGGVGRKENNNFNGHLLGLNAAYELSNYIKNEICVDDHMQDQLIIFMALASGTSRIRTGPLTKHTRTAIYVAEQMTGVKFNIEHERPDLILLSCEGIGHQNAYL